jgi:hypothetical protein
VSEFYFYICTLKVFDWRPDQCQQRLYDKDYMNQWLREKMEDSEAIPALTYLTDNGHRPTNTRIHFRPHDVRMVDHVS